MQILKLSIQGFKSFTKEQTLDFTKFGDGLVFISGKNKVEPSLGGNGTGKSSLFEALTFAFYGKTSTNDKAGNLKNWQTKDKCRVVVEFLQHDVIYTLERTWNPNTLKLQEETVTQETIDTLLGMNFSAFIYSVFISQQADKFIDLAPVEKMDIFTTILDLDKWNTFSDKAKEKKNSYDKEMVELTKQRNLLEGEISGITLEDLDIRIEEYEVHRTTLIKKLQVDISNCELKHEDFVAALATQQKQLEEVHLSFPELEKSRVDITTKIEELRQKQVECKRILYKYEIQIDLGGEELDNIRLAKRSPTCLTCFQPINQDLLKQNQERIEQSLKENRGQVEDLEKICDTFTAQIKELSDEFEIEMVTYRELHQKELDLSNEITSSLMEVKQLKFQIENLTTELKALKEGVNPYTDMRKQRVDRLEKLTKDLQGVEQQQFSNIQQSCIYEFWIKGFKDTKLMLLSEALQEFEIETNNKLQELGMSEWSIKTEVDTETKSGTIKRGFTIMVKSPLNTALVPFTCWSGGEGQRLRLAVTLGLIDFIKNKRGVDWNILIFDEGTQFLSEEGIADLIATLKDKSVTDGLKIMLIDHRNLNSYGDFIKEIVVTKTENGSQIWNT